MRGAPGALGPLLLLSLLASAPPAAAQTPEEELVQVGLNVLTPPQEVPLLGQVAYEFVVEDRSVDRVPDGQGILHTIRLELQTNQSQAFGWTAYLTQTFFSPSFAGDTFRGSLVVQASPTVRGQFFRTTIVATLQSSAGDVVRDSQEVVTRLRPFSLATVNLPGEVPQVGPDQDVGIPVVIGNGGQYHDTFLVTAQGPEGWFVAVQPRLTLLPGEERTILVQATSPATKVFTPQESAVILVQVRSERDPGVVYERAAIVVLEGVFLPGYWLPLVALGAVLAVAAGAKAAEAGRRRTKEQGRPAPPRLTPAQAVLLADLKQRDPERYRAFTARQKGVFQARQRAWLAVRGKRDALERMLLDEQHAKVRAEKRAEAAAQRERLQREREVERQRAALLREKERREAAVAAQQRRDEQRRQREEERRKRLEAPNQRRLERERRAREAQLRAEMARKKRLLEAEQRRQRVAVEKRRRELERKRKLLQKRAQRAAPREKKEGGLFGRKGGPPEGGDGEGQP